jgi:hypothetical protein
MPSASGPQSDERPPNRPAGCGSMSTTMIRPATAGARDRSIIASVPPIEWPMMRGPVEAAVDDIAGDLGGERRHHRPVAIARAGSPAKPDTWMRW